MMLQIRILFSRIFTNFLTNFNRKTTAANDQSVLVLERLLKFSFSEKAQKIWKNLPLVLTLLSKSNCFVKTGGRFFQILWPSHNIWTLYTKLSFLEFSFRLWPQMTSWYLVHIIVFIGFLGNFTAGASSMNQRFLLMSVHSFFVK